MLARKLQRLGDPVLRVATDYVATYEEVNPASAGTHTFTACSLGAEHASRVIVVLVQFANSANIEPANTLTIGGVSATKVAEAWTNYRGLYLYHLAVPTGTTANIVVGSSTYVDDIRISIFRLTAEAGVINYYHSVLDVTNTRSAQTLNCLPGAAVIAGAISESQVDTTLGWNYVGQSFNEDSTWGTGGGRRYDISHGIAHANLSLTSTGTTTEETSHLAASFVAAIQGQQAFTTSGAHDFVVPTGVTSISAVVVGGGGGGGGTNPTVTRGAGGGGGLAYSNSVAVTPGETLSIQVGVGGAGGASGSDGTAGGASYVARGAVVLIRATGGGGGPTTGGGAGGAGDVGDTLRTGGAGGIDDASVGSGGGGAAGYGGVGGVGGGPGGPVGGGLGGGGGGGYYGDASTKGGGGGGGVGLLGTGANGTASTTLGIGGGGGSGGADGTSATTDAGAAGGAYGGGGGAANDDAAAGATGGVGAVRIIWGTGRSFPSTNTGDV